MPVPSRSHPQKNPANDTSLNLSSKVGSVQRNAWQTGSTSCKMGAQKVWCQPNFSGSKIFMKTCCHEHKQSHDHTPKTNPKPLSKAGYYTCPMHPEMVQDHPGNCPKCGMA